MPEAEHISITTTPDGMPFDLRPEQLPPVDGLAMLAAHPGRALTMVEWIDPAVMDERDMYATDAALDMYNPANGPPYAWLQRYRAAQRVQISTQSKRQRWRGTHSATSRFLPERAEDAAGQEKNMSRQATDPQPGLQGEDDIGTIRARRRSS
jgi:hypothetical protein